MAIMPLTVSEARVTNGELDRIIGIEEERAKY